MSTSRHSAASGERARIGLDEAEAALVEQYTRLVVLAYLTLPPRLTRHRRVLVAHGLVQRALPARTRGGPARVPASRPALWLRVRVLRAALAYERRRRVGPRPVLPVVWGLRLFPRAGSVEEVTLAQAMARVPAAGRAAFVLRRLEGLGDDEVAGLLREAGAGAPEEAVRASYAVEERAGDGAEALLRSREFDACTVQLRPTDLLRRRRRVRWAGLGAAVLVAAAGTLVAAGVPGGGGPGAVTVVAPAGAESADRLVRVASEVWADTGRVDFTAWPARGGRVADGRLLGRALTVWADPAREVRVGATPGTSRGAPGPAPQLLYAGEVDGETVVLFHDAQRLVRYGERDGVAALDFARADDADVTTAAAVALVRRPDTARYLLAPWIAESGTRDLLRPDTRTRPLAVEDGLTAPVPVPPGGGSCEGWPVLWLRSSERIVERHAFLVTDLGDPSPVHLGYTPPPSSGAPARQPREAVGAQALAGWARGACRLAELRGRGVRAVNEWDFAEQELPEDAGRAVWSCRRASMWSGAGEVAVEFRAPAGGSGDPARVVGRAGPTAACGRFGQHVVAATTWRAPGSGTSYLLAAGSREVTRIEVTGEVSADGEGRTLAQRADAGAEVRVRARLNGGEELAPVTDPGGS
ncbi:hypothetical protein AB0D49_28235 [Streptomyces sp. NPDC048290]|uniref:hypothetical protein n=1 Tax=Streptomyces sp. NPDC048290 TaxID=3155811 RepID=UPI003426EB99